MAGISVPIKLLHEARGHTVTCELDNGTTYRGKLLDTEDSMNIQLQKVTVTTREGKQSQLEQIFIRGSHVRFFIVPDMLKNAPMFKNLGPGGISRGRGLGIMSLRGRGGAPNPIGRGQTSAYRGRGGAA